MSRQLPERPAKYIIKEVLVPHWDASDAVGFDPTAGPGNDAHLTTAATVDNVMAHDPSLIVSYSNETTGGGSTYEFITSSGPASRPVGTVVVTARAESDPDGYTGDAGTYSAISGDDLVVTLIEAAENAAHTIPDGGTTALEFVGVERGPDAPHDFDSDPTVYQANTQIRYGYLSDA